MHSKHPVHNKKHTKHLVPHKTHTAHPVHVPKHTGELIRPFESLGGVIEAQSGSSGGAVVNAWGRLIGLISTTSEGDTTDARDLRAVTLSYINRDLAAQTQFDLATTLGGDVVAEALDFYTRIAPNLVGLYIEQLVK